MSSKLKGDQLLQQRLKNQSLDKPKFTNVRDVVKWFCATQAQDYLGSLWSIGQRIRKSVEKDVEDAVEKKEIVRTWPMRGTLHFVAADDVRWLTSLLAPRVITRSKALYEQEGLDAKTLEKSRKLIEKTLAKEGRLTREQLYDALNKNKIAVTGQRGIHIIGYAAHQQSICLGPREGKQHTFVLLDEWIPQTKVLSPDESLAELTRRYFDAHGPATINDLCWWSGLTQKEASLGIELVAKELHEVVIGDQRYWMKPGATGRSSKISVSLLSWFDEFIIGYKDRSAAFDPATAAFIQKPKNGLYSPVILVDGKIAGNWKRTFAKDELQIEIKLFRRFNSEERNGLDAAINRYAVFLSARKVAVRYN